MLIQVMIMVMKQYLNDDHGQDVDGNGADYRG